MKPQNHPNGARDRSSWASLILSVGLHSFVLILVGSYVIFEGVVPRAPFIPVDVDTIEDVPIDAPVMEEPEELPEVSTDLSLSNEAVTESTSEQSSAAPEIIVSSVPSTSFNLPATTAAPTQSVGLWGGGGNAPGNQGGSGSSGTAAKVGLRTMSSLFGSRGEPAGLVGTFYDPTRSEKGGAAPKNTHNILRDYIQSGSDAQKAFDDIWRSKETLSSNLIAITRLQTEEAYRSFGETPPNNAANRGPPFFVHYTARVAPPVSGQFRFAGIGDNYLIVSINGKTVFVADCESDNPDGKPRPEFRATKRTFGWESPESLICIYPVTIPFNSRFTYGDWIPWNAGDFKRIDILLGDGGGNFTSALFIQQKDQKYRDNDKVPVPVLPLFRLTDEKPPANMLEKINLSEASGKDRIIFETSGSR